MRLWVADVTRILTALLAALLSCAALAQNTVTTTTAANPNQSIGAGGTGASTAQGAAANLLAPHVICQSAVAVSAAAVTTEEFLYTCAIPANALGPNGRLEVLAQFTYTTSANNKTLRIRYSGTAGTQYTSQLATTTTSYVAMAQIANRGVTNSQIGFVQNTVLGTNNGTPVTSAVDTTAATSLVVSCQKALGTEACTLESVRVLVLHGA